MTSHDLSVLCIGMGKNVLNEIVAVLIACNLNLSASSLIGDTETHCQSVEFEDDQNDLHRHAPDSAPGNQFHQSSNTFLQLWKRIGPYYTQ